MTELKEEYLKISGIYGYKQSLFSSNYYRNRGCMISAFMNYIIYLSRRYEDLRELYPYSDYDEKSLLSFSDDLTKQFKTPFFGNAFISQFERGVKAYFKKYKRAVSFVSSINLSKDYAVDFICDSISEEVPIFMLNWNSTIKELERHWVLITGFKEDSNEIITTNHGCKKLYSLDKLFSKKSLYRAFVRVEIGERLNIDS